MVLTFKHLLLTETIISFLLCIFFFGVSITGNAVSHETSLPFNNLWLVFFGLGLLGAVFLVFLKK